MGKTSALTKRGYGISEMRVRLGGLFGREHHRRLGALNQPAAAPERLSN
jgi:hypothetical protein